MKDYPILFSTPMVQAILQGRKTQTRRLVKDFALNWLNLGFTPGMVADPDNSLCPFGKDGDLLWVRETWSMYRDAVLYKASNEIFKGVKWKPSIHLKKKNARIWLRNEGYKIERLNDISEDDAVAEGVEKGKAADGESYYRDYNLSLNCFVNAKTSFKTLWHSIHGSESWHENPWVWAVSFKVVSTNGKP
jgi:hypothetical protein